MNRLFQRLYDNISHLIANWRKQAPRRVQRWKDSNTQMKNEVNKGKWPNFFFITLFHTKYITFGSILTFSFYAFYVRAHSNASPRYVAATYIGANQLNFCLSLYFKFISHFEWVWKTSNRVLCKDQCLVFEIWLKKLKKIKKQWWSWLFFISLCQHSNI